VNRIIRAAEALGIPRPRNVRSALAKLAALFVALTTLAFPLTANAALSSATVALSDPQPSATANYTFSASNYETATAVKCVKEVYTVNADGTGGVPTGMQTNSATMAAGSTLLTSTNWGSNLSTTQGTVVFSYATGETPASGTKTVEIDGVTNSSVASSSGYFLTFTTYDSAASGQNCTGAVLDTSTVGFFITSGQQLSLTINGTLSFSVNPLTTTDTCADGSTHPTQDSTATTIPFGTLTSAAAGIVCQQLNAATNATNGYTIYLRYDKKPTNALAQTIGDWTGTNTAPTGPPTATNTGADGQGSYAYSTSDNTLGTGTAGRFTTGSKFAAATTSNAEVAYESTGVSSTNYTITHEVNITNTPQPGTYSNTIIYTCTPIY